MTFEGIVNSRCGFFPIKCHNAPPYDFTTQSCGYNLLLRLFYQDQTDCIISG